MEKWGLKNKANTAKHETLDADQDESRDKSIRNDLEMGDGEREAEMQTNYLYTELDSEGLVA